MNRPITSKETELVMKYILTKKSLGQMASVVSSSKHLKNKHQ